MSFFMSLPSSTADEDTDNSTTTDPRISFEDALNCDTERNWPIIAICHLQWDWVWQRPQQFLSRLAQTHPVLFVETHCSQALNGHARARAAEHHPLVTIVEIHLPAKDWHNGAYIDKERRRVLQDFLLNNCNGQFDGAVLWFNDPMAVTAYAGHLSERAVVYDCMDELTQFQGAHSALADRERELTRRADVIFCGGRKMRDKRLPLNSNTHFYGTGVDCTHFGAAMSSQLAVHPDIAALSGPVLGYFGVVDERIDYELIAALAQALPQYSIAMVGPIAKVDPARLPKHPNIHWLGGRPYAQLPAITKGFSVCLMPFALNAATEYINPTKALEYMATGRPVVSTALDEVRTNFTPIASVAANHDEFISLCRQAVESPSLQRCFEGLKLTRENTWDVITTKLQAHVNDVLRKKSQTINNSLNSFGIATIEQAFADIQDSRAAYV